MQLKILETRVYVGEAGVVRLVSCLPSGLSWVLYDSGSAALGEGKREPACALSLPPALPCNKGAEWAGGWLLE